MAQAGDGMRFRKSDLGRFRRLGHNIYTKRPSAAYMMGRAAPAIGGAGKSNGGLKVEQVTKKETSSACLTGSKPKTGDQGATGCI